MKKILYIFALCIFASTNLFMYCDDNEHERIINRDAYFTMEGGKETVLISSCSNWLMGDVVNPCFTIEGVSDYDWHSSGEPVIAYKEEPEHPDSLDCGWFQLVKNEAQVIVTALPNTTGHNRFAEVYLRLKYDCYSTGKIYIYQDCK